MLGKEPARGRKKRQGPFDLKRIVTSATALALLVAAANPSLANEDAKREDAKLSAFRALLLSPFGASAFIEPIARIGQLAPALEPVPVHRPIGFPADETLERFTPVEISPELLCEALTSAAALYEVPVVFFTRLIWQESRFNRYAVSRAGAKGVAQFMPRTAAEYRLVDPFDPLLALPASARLLRDLQREFGNWGLAAAAYNSGARRVRAWVETRRRLPRETRNYVQSITGIPAERWTHEGDDTVALRPPGRGPCQGLPESEVHATAMQLAPAADKPAEAPIVVASATGAIPKAPAVKPWRVELASHWSERRALASLARLRGRYGQILAGHEPVLKDGVRLAGRGASRKRVEIALDSRDDAQRICAKLKAAGGACIVQRN